MPVQTRTILDTPSTEPNADGSASANPTPGAVVRGDGAAIGGSSSSGTNGVSGGLGLVDDRGAGENARRTGAGTAEPEPAPTGSPRPELDTPHTPALKTGQTSSRSFGVRDGVIWLGMHFGMLALGLIAILLAVYATYSGTSSVALRATGTTIAGHVAGLREQSQPAAEDPCAATIPAAPATTPQTTEKSAPMEKTVPAAGPDPITPPGKPAAAPAKNSGSDCKPVAPAIRYVDQSGRQRCYVPNWYVCNTSYAAGQQVMLRVDDPKDPKNIRIETSLMDWLWPLILGGGSALMGFVGWLMRPSADKLAKLDQDPPLDDGIRVVSLAEHLAGTGISKPVAMFGSDAGLRRPLDGLAASAELLAKGEAPLDLCEFCAYMAALAYERIREDGKDTAATSVVNYLERFPSRPFTHIRGFWKDNTEGFGFVADGAAFIVLRGTADWADWKGNLDAGLTGPGELIPAGVTAPPRRHRGFASAWAAIAPDVRTWLTEVAPNANTPIIITGHSLGGALSFLAAWELKSVGRNVAGVVTFGSALPGDQTFAAAYKALGLGDRTLRLEFTQDLVPQVQKLVGYEPVGRSWEPKQLPFVSHRLALMAIPVMWLVASLQSSLFTTKKAEPASSGTSQAHSLGQTKASDSAAEPAAETRPLSERVRGWISKLLVFLFFSSILALAAHKMQKRYGLALSIMSYRKIRQRRLDEARLADPGKTFLDRNELAACYEDLRRHLRAIRGTAPDDTTVFTAVPNLPRPLESPTDVRWFNAFFPARSW